MGVRQSGEYCYRNVASSAAYRRYRIHEELGHQVHNNTQMGYSNQKKAEVNKKKVAKIYSIITARLCTTLRGNCSKKTMCSIRRHHYRQSGGRFPKAWSHQPCHQRIRKNRGWHLPPSQGWKRRQACRRFPRRQRQRAGGSKVRHFPPPEWRPDPSFRH